MARSKSSISNKVREMRFLRGEMTQEQLAKEVGITRQTVIAIEQGRFCPSLESALRMARVFNTPVDAIFNLED